VTIRYAGQDGTGTSSILTCIPDSH